MSITTQMSSLLLKSPVFSDPTLCSQVFTYTTFFLATPAVLQEDELFPVNLEEEVSPDPDNFDEHDLSREELKVLLLIGGRGGCKPKLFFWHALLPDSELAT